MTHLRKMMLEELERPVRPAKASTQHGDATPRRFAILLHQDAEEAMEHRRHSVSQESATSADHPELGRSRPVD